MMVEFDHYNYARAQVFCNSKTLVDLIKAGEVYYPDAFIQTLPYTKDHRQMVIDDSITEDGLHDEMPPEVAMKWVKRSMRDFARKNLKPLPRAEV